MPRKPDQLSVAHFVPNLVAKDAVGNHAMLTARVLDDAGIPNRFYVETAGKLPGVVTADFHNFQPRSKRTLILYQASTGASEMVSVLLDRPEPLTLYYHNITPGSYFAPYDPAAADQLDRARAELMLLAGRTRVAMAASEFNASELRGFGIEDVRVIPPFSGVLAAQAGAGPQNHETDREPASSSDQLLFVGRLVPSKGIDRLLAVMALLHRSRPEVRLNIVGAPGPWTYMQELERQRARMRLDNVRFLGPITDADLDRCYEQAGAFLTFSQHEGFGLTLVEAMARGVPVIALDAGATRETLGGAGVLVKTDDPVTAAEVALEVLGNRQLRKALVSRGLERAREIETFPRAQAIEQAIRAASAA